MRKDCPMSNKFQKGCKHWITNERHKFYGTGSCKFDLTYWNHGNPNSSDPFEQGSYGPFLKDTDCNRLGTVHHPDRFEATDSADNLVQAIDWESFLANYIGQAYEYPNFSELRKEFFDACIRSLSDKLKL